jgi:tetratricopeptide (TPR) repeat protein
LAIALLAFELVWPEARRVRARVEKVRPQRDARPGERQAHAPRLNEVAALAVLLASATAMMASPSSALRDYSAGKFDSALKEYQRLIGVQKDNDYPRLHFNAGTAAYRATNYDAAMKQFSLALSARDVRLQQAAYFNLGNTQFRLGAQAKELDALQQSWEAAIKSYQSAVALDKKDADAAYNLDFVKNAVEQIKLMREAALRARTSASEEVRRRNYHRAREIMESLLQQNIAAKPFEDFAKKLVEIDEIANPPQP